MPLFALPIADHANLTYTRTHYSSRPARKQSRRASSPSPSPSEAESLKDHDHHPYATSTNPLSLTPAEIAQYKLAGLDLDAELPDIKDFPHRPLPSERLHKSSRKGKVASESGESGEEKEKNEDKRYTQGKATGLKLQHVGVLTAILQKCLMEGDIPRATRAFSMLLRMQFGGHEVDIRSSGYWGIGAELLIRSMDERKHHASVDNEGDDAAEGKLKHERWGTKEGLNRAKEYYERLIVQYPYNRQFSSSVSALDFWPAMLGCEIYGIQQDQKERLADIETAEGQQDSDEDENFESEDEHGRPEDITGEDWDAVFAERRTTRRRQRRVEKYWQQREVVRNDTLKAAEILVARMKELMNPPPYSDSPSLLRLRGMLALYVGDLSVPTPHPDDADKRDQSSYPSEEHRGDDNETSETRRSRRTRRQAIHEGRRKQKEEHSYAKAQFAKVIKQGGWVQGYDDKEDEERSSGEEDEAESF